MRLEFTVPGKPDHMRRHRYRTFARKGAPFLTNDAGEKFYRLKDVMTQEYPDPKTGPALEAVRAACCDAMDAQRVGRLMGPLRALIVCRFETPKSYLKALREADTWKETTPDADNHLKLPLDALNGLVFEDDKTIADARVVKYLAKQGTEPGMRIILSQITEHPNVCR